MGLSYEVTACPVCASSDGRTVADREEIRAEVEALWAFHGRRLKPGTPPERLVDRVAFSQRPPLAVVQCRRCTLVYRNPREREFELEELYSEEEVDPSTLDALFETQLDAYRAQAGRLTTLLGRAGMGLEVGSYVGGFLAAARERGWRFEGVDINERATAFARSRGFQVHSGELDDVARDRRYDAIAIWNCFDQLAEPRGALLAARERLVGGGIFAARVPNGAFYARLRGASASGAPVAPVARAMLAHNNLLAFPYRHGFTVPSLERLLAQAGMRIVHLHGDALVPIADRWTRRWAALEERAVKTLLRTLARLNGGPASAPWIEVYAAPE